MPNPYLAPSLARLRTAIDTRWPGRDHTTDGWIGDQAHQARTSDHNPDPKTGVVRALDIDKDGIHIPSVIASAIVNPAVRYVIHNRRIYHVDNLFRPKKYTGDNAHTEHIHVSIEHTKSAEASKAVWELVEHIPAWPELRQGANSIPVRQLQALLNAHGSALVVDGRFGPGTRSAVLAFQRAKKIKVDGVAGPETYTTLRTR